MAGRVRDYVDLDTFCLTDGNCMSSSYIVAEAADRADFPQGLTDQQRLNLFTAVLLIPIVTGVGSIVRGPIHLWERALSDLEPDDLVVDRLVGILDGRGNPGEHVNTVLPNFDEHRRSGYLNDVLEGISRYR